MKNRRSNEHDDDDDGDDDDDDNDEDDKKIFIFKNPFNTLLVYISYFFVYLLLNCLWL